MADPRILSRIIQLGKELGANISNSIGTKSNVNFLGSGPKDGMLFQKDINPESFLAIGTKKVLPDIEASIGYASGNKLDGFQLQQLEKNLITMKESLSPTNVVEMGGGGIDSLRAKSGLVERQATEAASDIKSIDDAAAGVNKADAEEFLGEAQIGNPFKTLSKEERVNNLLNDIGMTPKGIDESIAADKTGIMASVAKGDLPAKTASAREFLVNSLKVGDDYPSTTLTDVMSAQDMKYIMEGGGGAMGDPLVLVQKYFGPRIAEMIPNGGTTEEIAIFTKRVMNNVEDAKGFRPDEPEFDAMTATFVDQLADGGRAGYLHGGRAGYFLGGNIEGGYSESQKDSGGKQTTTTFDGGGNDNPPPVTIGDGGITSVVTEAPKLSIMEKFKGYFTGGPKEEDEEEKMTKAANAVTNFKDYNETIQAKNKAITEPGLMKDLGLAKGGRAGYAKGGLAKILEL